MLLSKTLTKTKTITITINQSINQSINDNIITQEFMRLEVTLVRLIFINDIKARIR